MAVSNIYADGDDVQALINALGGATVTLGIASTPTLTQVEGWLDEYAAMVDARLTARGYSTVPASGTNDKLLIGHYVAQRGAARAFNAGFMYDETPDKVQVWIDEWNEFLKGLDKGHIRLIDQTAVRGRHGVQLAKRYVED